MMNFSFKGITKNDIIVNSLGRRQPLTENIVTYEIPYRNEELTEHTNTYKSYDRRIVFYCKRSDVGDIHSWLKGYGKLTTSVDVGGYFNASVINVVRERFSKNYDVFTVTFRVGFFYLDETPLSVTSGQVVQNDGELYSQPTLMFVGGGSSVVTITNSNGNHQFELVGIEGGITIDSELMSVYFDNENQGSKMVGKFPILEVGDNTISWTGDLTLTVLRKRRLL